MLSIDCKNNFSVCEQKELSECIFVVYALELIRAIDCNIFVRTHG